MFGLLKPKQGLLGMELSGTIVALGAKATKFKIGDAVMETPRNMDLVPFLNISASMKRR